MTLGPQWTNAMVGKELVRAMRWAQATAGRVGPGSPRAVAIDFLLMPSEREEEGWERVVEEADERPYRRVLTPAQITRLEQTLWWPSTYLKRQPGPNTVLKVWLRCKVFRFPFDKACAARKWSRATAYRARDRALAEIAVGLMRDRVEPLEE